MDCIFCKIVEKKISSKIVAESEELVAIEDLNPKAPLHLLILPRKHIPTILDIEKEDQLLLGKMFLLANELARKYGVAERGFRTVFNCNREAGQSVFHLHLHLLGGRLLTWPPG